MVIPSLLQVELAVSVFVAVVSSAAAGLACLGYFCEVFAEALQFLPFFDEVLDDGVRCFGFCLFGLLVLVTDLRAIGVKIGYTFII